MICRNSALNTCVLLCALTGMAMDDASPPAKGMSESFTVRRRIHTSAGTMVSYSLCFNNAFFRYGGLGFGGFSHFWFGRLYVRNADERPCVKGDGDGLCFMTEREMRTDEYRGFQHMKLYFTKDRRRLYKIMMRQTFARGSIAKERMSVVEGVVDDVGRGLGLELVRCESRNDFVAYGCSDDDFEIRLELCIDSDGTRRLTLAMTSKTARDDDSAPSQTIFDADRDIEISI